MAAASVDKVAVVTGGASGIGLAIAERLAGDGAKVAVFDLNAAEYYFAPDLLTAQPGTITINLTNIGPDRPHAFNLRDGDGNDIFTSDRAQPGDVLTLQLTLDAGFYQYYCPVTGHADRGEVGLLFVA